MSVLCPWLCHARRPVCARVCDGRAGGLRAHHVLILLALELTFQLDLPGRGRVRGKEPCRVNKRMRQHGVALCTMSAQQQKMMIFDLSIRGAARSTFGESGLLPQYRGECEYKPARGAADRHDEAGRLGEQAQVSWVPSAPPAASTHRGGSRARRRETSPELPHEAPPCRLAPLQLCSSALLNDGGFGRIRVRGWSAQPIRTIN